LRVFRTLPVRLAPADARTFAWLRDAASPPDAAWLKPEPFEDLETLAVVAELAERVRDARSAGAWLMQVGSVAVGLISYKQAPAITAEVEIGYSVAPAWRGRGIARRAVGELIALARADGRIEALLAHTDRDNRPSQRVLTRNGFKRVARRCEPGCEPVDVWRLPLRG